MSPHACLQSLALYELKHEPKHTPTHEPKHLTEPAYKLFADHFADLFADNAFGLRMCCYGAECLEIGSPIIADIFAGIFNSLQNPVG